MDLVVLGENFAHVQYAGKHIAKQYADMLMIGKIVRTPSVF